MNNVEDINMVIEPIPEMSMNIETGGGSGGTSDYSELSNKPQINGVELNGNKSTSDLGIEIPDVSDFITRSVDDLVNYYTKSETYTQTEVNTLIGNISNFHYQVVVELPETGQDNILYLVPKPPTRGVANYYDEYVYNNGDYELIGTTQIDLSNYIQKSNTVGLVKNDGTIDTNTYLTQHQDISGKQDVIQFATMPTASVDNLGKVYQYIGATDNTYTKGHFYTCITDAQETPTYSWQEISFGSGEAPKVHYISSNSASDPFVFEEHEPGIYFFNLPYNSSSVGSTSQISVKGFTNSAATTAINMYGGGFILYHHKISTSYSSSYSFAESVPYTVFTTVNTTDASLNSYGSKIFYTANQQSNLAITNHLTTMSTFVLRNRAATISAVLTYSKLPETSVAPTKNTQLTNKSYVDGKLATYTGYDATKTQVLKNINGTLTWVDES